MSINPDPQILDTQVAVKPRRLNQLLQQMIAAINAAASGLPAGGTTGQVLTKNSNADYDAGWAAGAAAGAEMDFVNGRLTLTAGAPVPTADVTAGSTIYFSPYKGRLITLWDGAAWTTVVFTETSLALSGMTTAIGYDVFAFLSAGVLAIEKLAWTSATARATAVTIQDGRYCKSGDKTRRYLGSFYTLSATTTCDTTGGSVTNVGGQRYVWNYYNRVMRQFGVVDLTATWAYTTATVRQARGQTGNKIEYFVGLQESIVEAQLIAQASLISNVGRQAVTGIGIDTITNFNTTSGTGYNNNAAAVNVVMATHAKLQPSAGYHYLAWNESGADGSCTFTGSNGTPAALSGLTGVLDC